MPKRDRIRNLALALIGGAIFVCVLVIGYGVVLEHWSEQNEVYARHQESAERQRQATANDVAATCGGLAGDALRSCAAKQIEAHDRAQTTSEDLQAQQEMALWGLWVFIAAAFSAGMTAVGVYLIWQTLLHTRDAVTEAKAATKAAQAAVTVTQDVGERQLRAYMSVKGAHATIRTNNVRAVVIAKNTGQTPALNVRTWTVLVLEPPPFNEDWLKDPITGRMYVSDVGADAEQTLHVTHPADIADTVVPAIKAGRLGCWVYGFIWYEDFYGQPRETRFRFVLELDEREGAYMFKPAEAGNKMT